MSTPTYRDGQWLRFLGSVPGAHMAGKWTLGIFRPAETIIFRTPKKKKIRQPDRVIPLTVHGEPIRLGDRDWKNLRKSRGLSGLLSGLEPHKTEFLLVAFSPDSLLQLGPVVQADDLPPNLIFRQFHREAKVE